MTPLEIYGLVFLCLHPDEPVHLDILRESCERFFVKAGRPSFVDSFDEALQAEPVRAYLGRLAPPPAQSGSSVK